MATKKPRTRTKEDGFVGASLAVGGDMTLYNRFVKAVKADPDMSQSRMIRLALADYLDKIGK